MTKTTTDLLDAKRRDVRRVTAAMFVILVLVIAGAGVWLVDVTKARDYWRGESDAAWSEHAALGEKYAELYDEFIRETGHLPYAESPDEATAQSQTGAAGPVGPVGPTGPRGPRGAPGEDGDPGDDGEAGEAGAQGETGATGAQGDTGAPGATGEAGAPGETGATGPKGDPGPAGQDGKDGQDGAPGEDGRGIASLSCDPATGWTVTYTDGETANAGPCVSGGPQE